MTELWQAGKLYLPGDLVQPVSVAPVASTALTNPDLETGTTSGWTITQFGGAGTPSAATDRPFAGTYGAKWVGAAGTGTAGGVESTWTNTTAGVVTPGKSITASAYIAQDDTGSSANWGRTRIYWYSDAAGTVACATPYSDGAMISGNFNDYRLSTVTASAPVGALRARLAVWLSANASGAMRFDNATWNLVNTALPTGLVYKAVQPASGTSGAAEPAWPATLGLTVVDNQVTWEAVQTSRVVWQASPILRSSGTEPVWPTAIGAVVSDGSIAWKCVGRHVSDPGCPQTKEVVIAASKVYAADGDIIKYSATVNPLDWSTPDDAGYLPYGLQNYGSSPTAALGIYRSNLVAFNAQGLQMWQIDEDPASSALMDAIPVGSTYHLALSPVSNDLFFLAAQGVRTIGIAAGSTNLAAGDVGLPIDPLVQDAMRVAADNGSKVVSTYYPGAGQYWLAFNGYPVTPAVPTIVLWGQESGSGGIYLNPAAAYNAELIGATTVVVTGYYSPALTNASPGYAHPPATDPLPISLDGFTLVPITPLSLTTGNVGPGTSIWWAALTGLIPTGTFYMTISINGGATILARATNLPGF